MTLPFENDTGPVIKRLAARSIQTDKRRNLFVIGGCFDGGDFLRRSGK